MKVYALALAASAAAVPMAGDYEHNDYPVSVRCFISSQRIHRLIAHRLPSTRLTRLILPRPSIRLMPRQPLALRRSPARATRCTLPAAKYPLIRCTRLPARLRIILFTPQAPRSRNTRSTAPAAWFLIQSTASAPRCPNILITPRPARLPHTRNTRQVRPLPVQLLVRRRLPLRAPFTSLSQRRLPHTARFPHHRPLRLETSRTR